MRIIVVCGLLIATSTTLAGAKRTEPVEHQVIAAAEARADAFNRRDVEAWIRLVADDCLISRDFGDLSSRDALATELRNLRAADEQLANLRNFASRRLVHGVVLHYEYDDREQFGDNTVVSTFAATEVWTRNRGRWVATAIAVTRVPINHRKPIAVDAVRLAEYAGRFEWRPGLIDTISVEGDHLVSKLGDSPPQPIYFAAPDVQFAPGELGEAVVQRAGSGEVSGYVFRKPDGQEILVRKLK